MSFSYNMNLLLFLLCIIRVYSHEYHMTVIIPSYNNEKFCEKNLQKLFSQTYKNFHVIYINDCSDDQTSQRVSQYIKDNNLHEKIILIDNPVRCGALRNIYMAIHRYCKDDDIVVIYDGDDWLYTQRALELVNDAYQDKNTWITYGNFSSTVHGTAQWCRPFERDIVKKRSYRKSSWHVGPLRTFYAWIFKKIELKDVLHEGVFYQMAWDQAFVHPLFEMADGRFSFIPQILYVYNEHNPINDWHVNHTLQHRMRDIILAQKPYIPLVKKPEMSRCEAKIYTVYLTYQHDKAPHIIRREHLEQDLQALMKTTEFLEHDMCFFADIHYKLSHQKILQHAFVLDTLQATIVSYATYECTQTISQQIRHSSYLWDSVFTFQVGWKPQLEQSYREYAWLIPTNICKKYTSYIEKLLISRSSYQPTITQLAQHAGLLIMTDLQDEDEHYA